jgi:hypothetical protein
MAVSFLCLISIRFKIYCEPGIWNLIEIYLVVSEMKQEDFFAPYCLRIRFEVLQLWLRTVRLLECNAM